mmetsp:Transcript_62053/g.173257  ORF Transcript_62053/g.173257 Transcript_62053/m.173257 type:complete len:303 (+) Transcript_62053:177-1085(+)
MQLACLPCLPLALVPSSGHDVDFLVVASAVQKAGVFRVDRVCLVQQRHHNGTQRVRHHRGEEDGHAQGLGVAIPDMRRHVRDLLAAHPVPEQLLRHGSYEEGPERVAGCEDDGQLPSVRRGEAAVGDDVAHDGADAPRRHPRADDSVEEEQAAVGCPTLLGPRQAEEDEVYQGDASDHGHLRGEGPAVVRAPQRQRVPNVAAEEAPDGVAQDAQGVDQGDHGVRDARVLEVHRGERQRSPGNGAEDPLQQDHAEGWDPEEAHELRDLSGGPESFRVPCAALLLADQDRHEQAGQDTGDAHGQ